MIKIILCILPILVLVSPFAAYAQNDAPEPFPKELFGVKLGSMYKVGAFNGSYREVGTFPVKAIRGLKNWMGAYNLYFQPIKEYEAFKYTEDDKKPDNFEYMTSFRLHLILTPPKTTYSSLKEMAGTDYTFEVVNIEWSENEIKKDSGYYWAFSFCKDIQADLGIKPTIVYKFTEERKEYQCSFIEGEKILDIRYRYKTKYFDLSYIHPIMKEKKEAAANLIRKMKMNEIRPY